jgi:hypothetical protein
MTDDTFKLALTGKTNRVIGSRGKRQQNALFTQRFIDSQNAPGGDRQPRSCRTEQAANLAEASGRAGHKDTLACAKAGGGSGNASHRLISGDQGVTHSGERRHAAFEQEALGAGADRRPFDVNGDAIVRNIGQRQMLQSNLPRPRQYYG